jgi:hypothetical protein
VSGHCDNCGHTLCVCDGEAGHWETFFGPQIYDLPHWLAAMTDDDWSFDDEVCAHDLGRCAIHMDWQEPLTSYTRFRFDA